MGKRLIIGLISISIFVSCAVVDKTGFVVRHEKKNIVLTSISDQPKIGYETDHAIIYLGQKDAIKQVEELLSSGKLHPRFQDRLINDLKINLDSLKKIQQDILVNHWQNQKEENDKKNYDFAEFIDKWILKDLILKGKTEIWNKSIKRFEKRITYHFFEDQFGGESCYYTFRNKLEFHRQILLLGE